MSERPGSFQLDDNLNRGKGAKYEPFTREIVRGHKFVNFYSGEFSAQMELNRQAVERLLAISAIDGIVVFTGLTSRDQQPAANAESTEALLYTTEPTPNGWRIEIDDTRISENSGEDDQRLKMLRFGDSFNLLLRRSLREIIIRDKLSGVKDINSRKKAFSSLSIFVMQSVITQLNGTQWYDIPEVIAATSASYGAANLLSRYRANRLARNSLTSKYEYFMPLFEIDRAARGLTYLNIHGRKLVRLAEDQGSR